MTKPLFLAQVVTYKSKAYYAGVQDWTQMTTKTKHLSVAISSDTLFSLPHSVSSIFLNDARFASNGIDVMLSLLTHLNPSSSKNLLLAISDLTCLKILVRESGIYFMSRVRGVSQRLKGVPMKKITPLFAIASLVHECYPGFKIRYLAGDPTLVNCDLLGLSGLL